MKRFLDFLNKKFDDIIQKEIESLTDKDSTKLDKAIKVVADLAILFFTYEEKDLKLNFEKEKIKKLSKKIFPLIFIEIIKIYVDQKEKEKEKKDKEEKINEEEKNDEEVKND
jgi:hypothetical protein